MAGAHEKMMAMSEAISAAHAILLLEMPTIEAFLKECYDMENFGAIVNPTLYRNPERRAVAATLEPICAAARRFVREYDAQAAKAQAALDKVQPTEAKV